MAVDLNLVGTIVGIIGNVISFGYFAAQAPIFSKIIKKQKVEKDVWPDPHIAMILSCALWLFYGLSIVSPQDILFSTMNGVGLVLEIAYLVTYCKYADEKQRWYVAENLALWASYYTAIIVVTLTVTQMFIGEMCALTMALVLKTKDDFEFEYMSVFLKFAYVVNGLTWMTYGLLGRHDSFIVGGFGCVALIYLIRINKSSTPKFTDASTDIEKPPRSVDLPAV